jgi:hypothetical protein
MKLVQPTAATKAWDTGELLLLKQHRHEGAAAVAQALGRTVSGTKSAAHRHGVSLRRPGSRRGSVLGQPRGISLRADIRADLLSGTVSAEVLAERVRLDHERELCPNCGKRRVRVKKAGWCLVCWRQKLAEAHFELLEELDAQRAMNVGKQALHRAREHLQERLTQQAV